MTKKMICMKKGKDGNLIFEIIQPIEPLANILMVDDNEIDLAYNGQQFANAGFKIDTATDGLEALNKVKELGENYDAILMNFLMPICDGIEATRLIRNKTKYRNPIIGFSSGMFSHKHFYEAGRKAGMYECVSSNEKEMLNTLLEALYNNKYKYKTKSKGLFSKLKEFLLY